MSSGRAKTATVKSERKKKVNLALCSGNWGGTKFCCQFALFTESDSASFIHSPGLSNVFPRRRVPGFEARHLLQNFFKPIHNRGPTVLAGYFLKGQRSNRIS